MKYLISAIVMLLMVVPNAHAEELSACVKPNGGLYLIGSEFRRQACRSQDSEVTLNQTSLLDQVVSLEDAGTTVRFTGVNVQVVNGAGLSNAPVNGTGNLIIGYDEGGCLLTGEEACDTDSDCTLNACVSGSCSLIGPTSCSQDSDCMVNSCVRTDKTGSHNVVIGPSHKWESSGCLISGYGNTCSGNNSIVGGQWNEVSGNTSANVSGSHNFVSGDFAASLGGGSNTVTNQNATICGGWDNTASGSYTSVSGGSSNIAEGFFTVVSGGNANHAAGADTVVGGGQFRSTGGMNQWRAGSIVEPN